MDTNRIPDAVVPLRVTDQTQAIPLAESDATTPRPQSDPVTRAAFRSVFDLAPVPMMITTGSGHIEYVNDALKNLLGYDIEQLQNPKNIITHPDDLAINQEIRDHLSSKKSGALSREKRYLNSKGEIVHAIVSIAAERDSNGDITRLFSQITDVTAQKLNEEKIRILSSQDSLTGLLNRRAFLQACESVLTGEGKKNPQIILFIDINRFKTINDSLGHRTGDIFLANIANRLNKPLGNNAIVGRLGGDEFAIMIPGSDYDVESVVRELSHSFIEPIAVHTLSLSVSASIGISLYPAHGTDLEHLLACADTAMYQAKNAKLSHQIFDGKLNLLNARWLEIEPVLRKTIEAEDFRYAYQDIFDIRNHAPTPILREALVRWQYNGKVVAPDDFIPLAEETGLIRDIDRASVRCTARDWIRDSQDLSHYTVNVSALTLNDHGFIDFLDQNTTEGLLKPHCTILEITETAVLSSTDQLLEILQEIRNRGFHLAIDDFGAGQTSIGLLSRLPADYIKLDRKLANHLGEGGVQETIVRALIDIAHDLQMQVICEGVETRQQLEWLMKFNCDLAQGYYLHRPEFLSFIK